MEDRAVLTEPSPSESRTRTAQDALPASQRLLRQIAYAGLASSAFLARALPRAVALSAAGTMGRVAFSLARRERRRVIDHLAIAFPEMATRDRVALARRIFHRLGQNAAEVLRLKAYGRERLIELVRFEGLDHLKGALARGQGALLVTGHVGCWELMAAAISLQGLPLNVIAREVYDPRMDHLIVSTRAAYGVNTIQREGGSAAREILRTLKRGEILGLLIDVDIKAPGVFVPFFGRLAWTPTGAAAFSIRARAPVVMGFIRRDGMGHVIRFEAPMEPMITEDKEADLLRNTARYTERIEAAVRRQPEDWVWTHRRWRRVPGPGGEPFLPHRLPVGSGSDCGGGQAPALHQSQD